MEPTFVSVDDFWTIPKMKIEKIRQTQLYKDLFHDIRLNGVQTPLVVEKLKRDGGLKYSIVDGLSRFVIAVDVGRKSVPVFCLN